MMGEVIAFVIGGVVGVVLFAWALAYYIGKNMF